jgi:UPF0271 protein
MGVELDLKRIDLNCDLGESFGAYAMGQDEVLIPYISSANIACGFHAGDPATMRRTVRLCLDHNVAVGAHPGLPDLTGFGRRNMNITAQEAYEMVLYQIGALAGFVKAEGGRLHHVKPHGALYNMAARDLILAEAVAKAVVDYDDSLLLYGLSGSCLIEAAQAKGLQTASEVFADRTYQLDGSLTPRSQPNALIKSIDQAVAQVLEMILYDRVSINETHAIKMKAETICIHGDSDQSSELVLSLQAALSKHTIKIKKCGSF